MLPSLTVLIALLIILLMGETSDRSPSYIAFLLTLLIVTMAVAFI